MGVGQPTLLEIDDVQMRNDFAKAVVLVEVVKQRIYFHPGKKSTATNITQSFYILT